MIIDDELFGDTGLSVYFTEKNGEIGVKFYNDATAFNGEIYDDEYRNWVEPIPIEEMTPERLDGILSQIQTFQTLNA